MVSSTPTSWTLSWPWSHFLVILLLIYSVTRRKCSSLHVDTLGTAVHGVSSWCGNIAIGLKRIPNFAVFRKLVLLFLTLFSTFGVAGHIVAILDDLLKPRFTYGLVEILVRGASLPLPSRDYQLVHRSLFPC